MDEIIKYVSKGNLKIHENILSNITEKIGTPANKLNSTRDELFKFSNILMFNL